MEGMVSQARLDLQERWAQQALKVRGENQVSVERWVARECLGRRATVVTRASEASPEKRVSAVTRENVESKARKVLLEKLGSMEVQVRGATQDLAVQPASSVQ
jgi:hypothetical protein